MACELLVMREYRGAVPRQPMTMWQGSIVNIFPAGHKWGSKEDPDQSEKFYVITIEDQEYDDPEIRALLDCLSEDDNDFEDGVMRVAFVDIAGLPKRLKMQLRARGRAITTLPILRRYLKSTLHPSGRW